MGVGDTFDDSDKTWGFHVAESKSGRALRIDLPKRLAGRKRNILLIRIQNSENPKLDLWSGISTVDWEHEKFSSRKAFRETDKGNEIFSSMFDTRKQNDELDEASRARLIRSRLLFLWGIGPCLSSLIHLEVMGSIYDGMQQTVSGLANKILGDVDLKDDLTELLGDDWEKAKKRALLILAEWEKILTFADVLIFLYAQNLRCNLLRNVVAAKKKRKEMEKDNEREEEEEEEKEAAARFQPMPDFSPQTLGINLNGDHNAELEGIFGDTLKRLQLALIYIDIVRGRLENVRTKTPDELKP